MTKPEGRPSLLEFAAAQKKVESCRVCELPEVDEIHAARKAGVSYQNIVRWLVEVRGYEPGYVSDHRLTIHLTSHV